MARGRCSSKEMNNGLAWISRPLSGQTPISTGIAWTLQEYRHVVLDLMFLKYFSDAFEERYAQFTKDVDQGAEPRDPDKYPAAYIFWMPKETRWCF